MADNDRRQLLTRSLYNKSPQLRDVFTFMNEMFLVYKKSLKIVLQGPIKKILF